MNTYVTMPKQLPNKELPNSGQSLDFDLSKKRPRKEIYRGRIINVGLEQVTNAQGEVAEFEIVRHPGGAVVVALNDNNEICLLRQYRHAIDQWIWELPAGKLEPDEPADITVQRELQEEAGVIAKHWQLLGSPQNLSEQPQDKNIAGKIFSSPGVFDEALYLFLAQDLSSTQSALEPHEFIEVHWVDIEEAFQWSLNNTINDAKSIIAIVRAYHLLKSQ